MRRLAQAGGRLCPHRFTAALEARIAARLAAELRPAAGAEAALAALRSAGIAARVVAAAPRARLEAALAHLPADWRALAGEIPAASPGVLIARDPRLAGTGRAAGLTVLAPEGGLDSIDWPA
jgi:hypothetical protein